MRRNSFCDNDIEYPHVCRCNARPTLRAQIQFPAPRTPKTSYRAKEAKSEETIKALFRKVVAYVQVNFNAVWPQYMARVLCAYGFVRV